MCSSPMPAGGRGRPVDTKASTLDPALLHLVTAMNLFGTVYTCNGIVKLTNSARLLAPCALSSGQENRHA